MSNSGLHTFHIPVMGLGYTIDTPVKVGKYGISSVVSIIEDHLVEKVRKYYYEKEVDAFIPIETSDVDHRAKRITSYLNLLDRILSRQIEALRLEKFEAGTDIVKYFEMLPSSSRVKMLYEKMLLTEGVEKTAMQQQLRKEIKAGDIDVNIMTKCDRNNYDDDGEVLPPEYADAMAALRGFAQSTLSSSVVFSAGMNPRLYAYCESFDDFLPDANGNLKKKIILKVSDFRSAFIQGKILAKKGLWISEYRIESGLNCGGHAFATEGLLLGPILDEFKSRKSELEKELWMMCNEALKQKSKNNFGSPLKTKITVQGGIGTAIEDCFLREYFELDGCGWGSPFLLVPEATNVDEGTLDQLVKAKKEDYFLSHASPLGIPINNFAGSTSILQRNARIDAGRPGSPCYKKFLGFNTEFTTDPICTASREYQAKKINQLKEQKLSEEEFEKQFNFITEKECLCEGLGASTLIKDNLPLSHSLTAVSICPGPNLAYFSGVFSLKEMVDHIYGKVNILNQLNRPNLFVNELVLYVDYFLAEINMHIENISAKQTRYFDSFKENLLKGVEYYKNIIPEMKLFSENALGSFGKDLERLEDMIRNIQVPIPIVID